MSIDHKDIGRDHTVESRMTYTPSHNSCTASVKLYKHALPHACLLYSDACVSVSGNADKHALVVYFESNVRCHQLALDIGILLCMHGPLPPPLLLPS